ncbi:MAG: hypothetical protein HRU15_12175 [Planctomycetes bacterium]|nr:hypothetical protein [Planctomycetota bacterium]
MNITIICTVLVSLLSNQLGCLWIDGTTIDGAHTVVEGRSYVSQLKAAMESSAKEAHKHFVSHHAYLHNGEDYDVLQGAELRAVLKILDGNAADAVQELDALEVDNPGSYSVASNLGTAYELSGNNVAALKWITIGIERNAHAHHGTEWLHTLILEVKIKLQENPDFLRQGHIIPLPEVFMDETVILIGETPFKVSKITKALEYQLLERVVFVKPEDEVVADLLFTLARINAQTNILEESIELLQLSSQYGFAQSPLLIDKLEEYKGTIVRAELTAFWKKWLKIFGCGFAIFGILYVAYKRKVFFWSQSKYKEHLNSE